MKCPNCVHENSADARFCENCGQPLEAACPNCGSAISTQAKFCKTCGFDLTGTLTARAAPITRTKDLDALRRAVPERIATKIMAEREQQEGERKLVTALFADIVGSTSLAEQMDPEDWREIVAGAHRRVSEAVYRYEGTIAQLLGDGVLAFFGAPLAHEDDAERAIRSALDIQQSIEQFAAELAPAGKVEQFQVRVGINTGLVVVGNIGSDLHMEYLAVGDTVNLAARVQSAAEPATVLVTSSTHRLAGSVFDYEDRGKIEIKGKSEPIQLFRVLRERKGAVRERGISGLSSPLVGRHREFSTLLQVTGELREGRGSTVAILGEAGLGKSRLASEWKKAALAESSETPLGWFEGRCLSYGGSMAHHLSTDILRALIGASADAMERELHGALQDTLRRFVPDTYADVYPFLGHLLGLHLEEDVLGRVKFLDGPALQAKYIAAYLHLLQTMARRSPLVIICEDVHWADPSSVELMSHVIPIVADSPVVFAFVTRADRDSAGWKLVTQAHEIPGVGALEIHLAPLSESDSQLLVRNLLEIESLPTHVRELILTKAEGNPFFVEEVIRMLIDRGAIAFIDQQWVVSGEIGDLEIPDTLQGVLTARIDRLPEDAKRTLQIASVIGRKFQVKVLQRILDQHEP
ncbi:MAG: adenylate/guanylate cyclase domain-containing protein [Anaerolineales bacterium]